MCLSTIIRLTSLSTLYNSGGGQMERSARLQARVVISEGRPDNTQNKHQVMNLQKIALTRLKRRALRHTSVVSSKKKKAHWTDPIGWITGTLFNLKRLWPVTRFIAYPSIIDL
jgi:hypothetical protein